MEKTPRFTVNRRHLGASYLKVLAGIIVLLSVLALSGNKGFTQVYRWIDENGNTHYAGTPHAIPELYRSEAKPIDPRTLTDVPRPTRSIPLSKTAGSPTMKHQSPEVKIALAPKPGSNATKPGGPQTPWWVLFTSVEDNKGYSAALQWEGDSWTGCQGAGADYYRSITSQIIEIKSGFYVDRTHTRRIRLVANDPGRLSYLITPYKPDDDWTRVTYSWFCKQVR